MRLPDFLSMHKPDAPRRSGRLLFGFHPIVPTFAATAFVLAFGLASLHIKAVAEWDLQAHSIRDIAAFAGHHPEADDTMDERLVHSSRYLVLRSKRVPTDGLKEPEGCKNRIRERTKEFLHHPDNKETLREQMLDLVCKNGQSVIETSGNASRLILMRPYFDERHNHMSTDITVVEVAPKPSILDLANDWFDLAVVALIACMAGLIAHLWARTTLKTIQHLDRSASYDALTGTLRRGAFDEELMLAMSEARKQDLPLSLLLIDVDRLKQINDGYGHNIGDKALKSVAAAMRNGLRATDILGRIGGDEFAAILMGANEVTSSDAAERVRRFAAETQLSVDGQTDPIQITVSIGVAQLKSAESAAQFMARTDQLLYEAKDQGRNQVVMAK